MNMFSKSNLEDGLILEDREGYKYLKIGNLLKGENCFNPLTYYNEDLTSWTMLLDIVRIYRNNSNFLSNIFKERYLELIWERESK